ncbi:YifB family Mg chelatase-like AAA ATPase [Clostridium oryzae]|uniref:Competence protein ComM n=1 Tax=Clostridium oryzae TaxID=1450648 RepID=A0A1V4IPQ4_9CLOT|nr:YifB family Mg chelatase-like AAA ATPase [Clostridium oryzae]OPJ61794.1 competence protein ComM [Clostridium oryzae]
MAIKLISSTLLGISGMLVSVEIDISKGLPSFNIVGLPDTSVKEARARVYSAITNSDYSFPLGRITVNLAPGDIRKAGTLFDLPIALGILLATDQIFMDSREDYLIIGELCLDGSINRVNGVLPIVMEGYENNINNYIIPYDNANEASILKSVNIYPFKNLREVVNFLYYKDKKPYKCDEKPVQNTCDIDFSDVKGQESCKRALEIATAGNHNTILFGPPGCGKSMMAKRISTIMPSLSEIEALTVTKIYSVSGLLNPSGDIIRTPPFRAPHHSITKAALIGGGAKLYPGEISLAHNGILFLDELSEFDRSTLELLREPLEENTITISRSTGTVKYPANFLFIAAMNPCRCGYYLSGVKQCHCTEPERKRYINKFSGPFLDRVDIFSFAHPNKYNELVSDSHEESSKDIKKRVQTARDIQAQRYINENINYNGNLNEAQIKKYCKISQSSLRILEKYFNKYNISARSYNKILKVSRTIADLNGSEAIKEDHLAEAIQYRQFIDTVST